MTCAVPSFADPPPPNLSPVYSDLYLSAAEALRSERERLADLKQELTRLEEFQRGINTDLKAYKLQISAHGSLLLLPGLDVKELERAAADSKNVLANVQTRLRDMALKKEATELLIRQTRERAAFNAAQLSDIAAAKDQSRQTQLLKDNIKELQSLFSEKERLLSRVQQVYAALLEQSETAQTSLTELSDRFDEEIKTRKKQNLLARRGIPFDTPAWLQTQKNIQQLARRLHELGMRETWSKLLPLDWKAFGTHLFAFIILLLFWLYLLIRLSRFGKALLQQVAQEQFPHRHLALLVFQRSIPLVGVILFIYAYRSVSPIPNLSLWLRPLLWLLLLILLTRVAKQLTGGWLAERRWMDAQAVSSLTTLIAGVRYIGIAYLAVDGLIRSDAMMLFVLRLLMAAFIFSQLVRFWKSMQRLSGTQGDGMGKKTVATLSVVKGISHFLPGAGVVLDISGYHALAVYWYKSWGISLVVMLVAGLLFMLLMEWRRQIKARPSDAAGDAMGNSRPIPWALLQLLWLGWFLGTVFALVLAWGGKQAVVVGLIRSLNYPISIGKISFSIMNFIFAFIILVLTHSLVRLWRHILREKILADSGLEAGLQDSITTITAYAFWAFGILLSLHAFGLGTTSLALAFGALGIGLGFGLQNIFNNFISGIIMLFERPIQVGDDVEINGVWATVKKINVRATVVQTYDNASLIIPNSEFISSQVTNWSFKDKRLRRNIDVGVAYGSNTELVRDTLLEIADATPKVFKHPKPDVVFRDFGDSALIFRLRVWTDIDNIFNVETAVRFAIDRRFNEKGIVIAFPQRDVHVYYENKGAQDA